MVTQQCADTGRARQSYRLQQTPHVYKKEICTHTHTHIKLNSRVYVYIIHILNSINLIHLTQIYQAL